MSCGRWQGVAWLAMGVTLSSSARTAGTPSPSVLVVLVLQKQRKAEKNCANRPEERASGLVSRKETLYERALVYFPIKLNRRKPIL